MGWLSIVPVVGDIMNMVSQHSTDQTNQDIANQANLTTQAGNAQSLALAQQNIQMETDFAKHGLSWKIADAAANGISPLAAIGASGTSYSPVSAVFNSPLVEPVSGYHHFDQMGQDVQRAVEAQQSPAQKLHDANQVVREGLENDLLTEQVKAAKLNNTFKQTPPGIPSAWMTVYNRDGTTSVVPTAQSAQSAHGSFLGPLRWSLDNQYIPLLQDTGRHLLDVGQSYPQGGTSLGLDQ